LIVFSGEGNFDLPQIILEKIAKNLEQLLRATRTSRLIAIGKFR
jgi:hypothetical protein